MPRWPMTRGSCCDGRGLRVLVSGFFHASSLVLICNVSSLAIFFVFRALRLRPHQQAAHAIPGLWQKQLAPARILQADRKLTPSYRNRCSVTVVGSVLFVRLIGVPAVHRQLDAVQEMLRPGHPDLLGQIAENVCSLWVYRSVSARPSSPLISPGISPNRLSAASPSSISIPRAARRGAWAPSGRAGFPPTCSTLPVGRLVTLTVNNPPAIEVPRLEEMTPDQIGRAHV